MAKDSRQYLLSARVALAFLVVAPTVVALIGDFFAGMQVSRGYLNQPASP